MRQLQPVLWTKGVTLSPQHLQTQDRFLEDRLRFQLGTLSEWPWGFTRLEIDEAALRAGHVSIVRAAGVFPDGLIFEIPESDESIPPREIAAHWRPDRATMDVYLAVRELRGDGRNVAAEGHDDDARFRAAVVSRRDEVTGADERPVQIARKNLRLLVEGEAREGYSVLPLARLRRGKDGEASLDPAYIPPLLDFAASPPLLARARRIVDLLSARSTELARLRRQQNVAVAHFSVADVANFWLLFTVNSHLPILRHLADVRRGHPAELYEELVTLGGSLTTFGTDVHPRDFPSYDHLDLGGCFDRLDTMIQELLRHAVPENVLAFSLVETQPTIHATALDDERVFTSPRIFLAVRTDLSAQETAKLVPQLVKVSSADRVSTLVRQALGGAALAHVAAPPAAVPVRLDHQYFELAQSGPEWNEIRRARNLAAYVPSELARAELQLVAVLGTRA